MPSTSNADNKVLAAASLLLLRIIFKLFPKAICLFLYCQDEDLLAFACSLSHILKSTQA